MIPTTDRDEEADHSGFLEEAPARPGGQVSGGGGVPRPQGGVAREARAQRRAWPGRRPAAQKAARRRIPRPPGRSVCTQGGTLAGACCSRIGLSTDEHGLLPGPSIQSVRGEVGWGVVEYVRGPALPL